MQANEFEQLERALYTYRFRSTRVIDGDTVEGYLDLGLHIERKIRLRLLGIDAPERKGATQYKGVMAREHLATLLSKYGEAKLDGQHVLVQTSLDRDDKYGRLLGTLYGCEPGGDLVNLNERMVHDGHAEPAPASWGR